MRFLAFASSIIAAMGLLVGCCSTSHHSKPSALCGVVDQNVHPKSFTGTVGPTHGAHATPAPQSVIVRKAQGGCCDVFDRVMLSFDGPSLPTYDVSYVNPPIEGCGSGLPVPTAGHAFLQIHMVQAQAHDEDGHATIPQLDQRFKCPNLRQLVEICDFEGHVDFVIGLDSTKAYRVVELQNPTRLVIDVKH